MWREAKDVATISCDGVCHQNSNRECRQAHSTGLFIMPASLASLEPAMPDDILRPPSAASVYSVASATSAPNITRRQRTRTRSKTVTGAPPTPRSPVFSELPYLDKPFHQEPATSDTATQHPPVRPPRSPARLEDSATPSTQNTELAAAEATFVEAEKMVSMPEA